MAHSIPQCWKYVSVSCVYSSPKFNGGSAPVSFLALRILSRNPVESISAVLFHRRTFLVQKIVLLNSTFNRGFSNFSATIWRNHHPAVSMVPQPDKLKIAATVTAILVVRHHRLRHRHALRRIQRELEQEPFIYSPNDVYHATRLVLGQRAGLY